MKHPCLWLLALSLVLCCQPAGAAEQPRLLEDETFQDQLRELSAQASGGDRLDRAQRMVATRLLSSLQVRTICARLPDDATRLEFATTAYPRTVDPENFYEVYDAFTSFSKVMRLHDRVRGHPAHRPGPPVVSAPLLMTDEDMKPILQALRKESFDNVRTQVARQILTSSPKKFLSSQVRRMMDCFDFEPPKLELAKFAYNYTYDREKFFLLNDAFSFESSKTALARFIESKTQPPPTGNR